jgi:hypothetical protein
MNAPCLAGSSLREIALGLRCSMPRRCSSAISPEAAMILLGSFVHQKAAFCCEPIDLDQCGVAPTQLAVNYKSRGRIIQCAPQT